MIPTKPGCRIVGYQRLLGHSSQSLSNREQESIDDYHKPPAYGQWTLLANCNVPRLLRCFLLTLLYGGFAQSWTAEEVPQKPSLHVYKWPNIYTYVQRNDPCLSINTCVHVIAQGTQTCVPGTRCIHVQTCAPMLKHTSAHINMCLVAWQTWLMNPQRSGTCTHMCAPSLGYGTPNQCRSSPTYSCARSGASSKEVQSSRKRFPVCAYTEVGDLMKVRNFK